MIGFVFAAMLFATLAVILLPLLRAPGGAVSGRADYEINVYRDQLAEVEHEVERGLIGIEQADASRLEIQRRILASAAQSPLPIMPGNRRANLIVATLIATILPLGVWQIYSLTGSPALHDQPFAGRQNDPDMQLNAATSIIAATLAAQPDAEGFKRLAAMYYALRRYDRAADAYQKALDLNPQDAEVWGEFGESLVMANDGAVAMEAQDAFKASLARNKNEPRSRFYMGLAYAQVGETKEAIAIWRDIERNAPPNAPWLRTVKDNIRLYAKQGGFDPASVPPEPAS